MRRHVVVVTIAVALAAVSGVSVLGIQAPQAPKNLRLLGTVPASVTVSSGNSQVTAPGTAFAAPLKASVRDANANPVPGTTVSFLAPASGASATFSGQRSVTAVTDTRGIATAPTLVANATLGNYTVTASVGGLSSVASFTLTNDSQGSGAVGVWTNVTPAGVNLTAAYSCGNYGTKGVQVDPLRPQDVYVSYNCQGIWKSTDYGQTWTGPINTGLNGSVVNDCAGAIAIAPGTAGTPILYQSCIRGAGLGFWRSTNGGRDWTRYVVAPPAPGGAAPQEFYSPAVDPYDGNHLIMAGHGVNLLVESTDGGQNWTAVRLESGMMQNGGTGSISFINTGSPATTRTTWLWLASSADLYGTWRTTTAGAAWVKVDKNEHTNGSMHSEIYQPDASGVIYMAGSYSALGYGVLRSNDYGQTWAHVGLNQPEAVVIGTQKSLYAMYGWGIGPGATVAPSLEVGDLAGGAWTSPGTPAAMTQGAGQAAVTRDATHSIIFMANYNAGLWRYIEP